ncbi:MAG: NAD-dependent epimerase/dehydratase family protein [Rikenellaceae bacterium]|nr:NAD-dependent epimerase/dehydratase family protein [Rikenellaceae bacterium]
MQKKVVILGGVGLIGTHLALKLLQRGYEVYCVDSRELSSSPLLRDTERTRFHFVRHNIVTPFTIRCDEIYNLCAPTRLSYDKQLPVEALQTYLQGSFNTLENARTKFSKVLYASSAVIYDNSSRPEFDPRERRAAMIEGVRAAEMIHRAYAAEYGVDCRIARLFNTYGSGCDLNDRRVVTRMIASALQNREITIFGSGEQVRSFAWAGDIADGLIALMEATPATPPRTLDLGGDTPITIRALAEKIIDLTGSRSQINHLSARYGEIRERRPDLSTAGREVGWRPKTPLIEGLKRTIKYVENQLASYSGTARTWVEIYG